MCPEEALTPDAEKLQIFTIDGKEDSAIGKL